MLFGLRNKQERTFAIGDVHGCARELELLLERIQPQANDTVVFLGDYIDRGPESRRVIDIIIGLQKTTKVVALMGNHEQMFMDFLERPETAGAGLFVLNGGGATLNGYATGDGSFAIPDDHLQFLHGLKLFFETKTHFFVHAGVPNHSLSKIDPQRDAMTLLWVRQSFLHSPFRWEKVVVHGHTPVEKPEVLKNRINLDTGCVYDGFLTALELPSGKIHQVEKSTKGVPEIVPRMSGDNDRIAMRFSGNIPVEATGTSGTFEFETLNYNKFGLLMREKLPSSALFKVGDLIDGRIGLAGPQEILFKGQIVRSEARGDLRLFGVKISSISNDKQGFDDHEQKSS